MPATTRRTSRASARQAASPPVAPQPASLLRRMAALLYDGMLLLGVEFLAFVIYTMLRRGGGSGSFDPLALAWLLGIAFLFYGWFWTHGGQTLGMRTWRIRVQTRSHTPISWSQALLRFIAAIISWLPLGLGFWWSLWDREKMTWHDRWSESLLVRTDRPDKGR